MEKSVFMLTNRYKISFRKISLLDLNIPLDAMNKILQSNVGLKEMGRRSKNMTKRFDEKIINQETIALYGIHI